jgi:hypothetical protein
LLVLLNRLLAVINNQPWIAPLIRPAIRHAPSHHRAQPQSARQTSIALKSRVVLFSIFVAAILFPFWMVSISWLAKAPSTLGDNAHAQNTTFYEGKTVRIVTFDSVGGYNFLARLLARHLPKYISGNPNFIVQHMPGAGSVIATNYVSHVAKPDGLTVGMPNQRVYLAQLLGDKEANFDMRKFNWIGSPDRNPSILYIRADAPYKSIDDIIK